ncbi:hypothetical protein HPB47_003531, partial [Ixodes persulcatus]
SGSRRQFTIAFKKAIAYADIHGNLAAQRVQCIGEKHTLLASSETKPGGMQQGEENLISWKDC